MTASVSVRVQGSTANLGSGFDCVGIAVDRAIRVVARRGDARGPVQLVRRGALEGLDLAPEKDLLFIGFTSACRAAGSEPPTGLTLEVTSDIPVARGLGSSAAAVVAGAVAARALLSLALDDAALARVCAEVEGHADNVAPSVWGGAMLVLQGGDRKFLFTPLEVHPSLVLAFAIPDFQVSTERARAVLPKEVSHHTAVVAAAKSAALVQGLARGDAALLAAGLEDVLHVPHRRALIHGYDQVVAAAKGAGAHGATLSGSGSTLVAVAPVDAAAAVERAMGQVWRAQGVGVETFRLPRPAGRYEVS
jgi:homoserine kinase